MSRLAAPLLSLLKRRAGAALHDWQPLLTAWGQSAAGCALIDAVDARVAAGAEVFPAQVFRAFELTPLARVRVVILGQDPYHGAGQAEGLAFSVPPGVRVPPSLRNIQLELQRDLQLPASAAQGSLLRWAEQGVLLLNAALTVEAGRPGAHAGLGWHSLTDSVCATLAADPAPKVFMLWGAHAQARAALVQAAGGPHLLLQSNHPSPLSARRQPVPFIGCGHFSEANRFLEAFDRGNVDWRIP